MFCWPLSGETCVFRLCVFIYKLLLQTLPWLWQQIQGIDAILLKICTSQSAEKKWWSLALSMTAMSLPTRLGEHDRRGVWENLTIREGQGDVQQKYTFWIWHVHSTHELTAATVIHTRPRQDGPSTFPHGWGALLPEGLLPVNRLLGRDPSFSSGLYQW